MLLLPLLLLLLLLLALVCIVYVLSGNAGISCPSSCTSGKAPNGDQGVDGEQQRGPIVYLWTSDVS
jgi:hypothetical protein